MRPAISGALMPARTPGCKRARQKALAFRRNSQGQRRRPLRLPDAPALLPPGAGSVGDYLFAEYLGGGSRHFMALPCSVVLARDIPAGELILHHPHGLDDRSRNLPFQFPAQCRIAADGCPAFIARSCVLTLARRSWMSSTCPAQRQERSRRSPRDEPDRRPAAVAWHQRPRGHPHAATCLRAAATAHGASRGRPASQEPRRPQTRRPHR